MAERYRLTLDYDGSGFSGWQRQEDGVTSVQGVVEAAIRAFSGETVTLHVAGRTDAGVHAQGQVAHVDFTRTGIAPGTIRDAVNFHVRPHPVAITEAMRINDDFHARFSATQRRYRYQICNRRAPPVLGAHYYWHVPQPLDAAAMAQAARLLLGKHDFSTFRAQHCQASGPIRTLDALEVARDGDIITIAAAARSFLYHQVRNMVGTLALVGRGQWSLDDFAAAFKSCDRQRGGPTAPPQGLTFLGPVYPASHQKES